MTGRQEVLSRVTREGFDVVVLGCGPEGHRCHESSRYKTPELNRIT